MIEIKRNRIILRYFQSADAPEIFGCITPTLTRFMSWEPPETLADFEKVGQSWQLAFTKGTDIHFVVRSAVDNRFIGLSGVHKADTSHPELGIWVREELHGQGYGREIIGAVVEWATENLNVEYFRYPVASENRASRRIAQAYGGKVFAQKSTPKYEAVIYHIPPVSL